MSALVEFVPPTRSSFEDVELEMGDVRECVKHLEKVALATFLGKPRSVETVIREWMAVHRRGTVTTRPDFDEAVRHYIAAKW